MNHTATHQDPDAIERDIRRTQDDMSRTVDRIEDQLTPRNMMNALLDQAEANGVDARMLIDGARRNPIALAMIAGGAIWLVSDNDAKLPKMKHGSGSDHHHRDYVSHMQSVEMRDGEDLASYQRRRDVARANFLIIERRHDEDESSFRKRLDDAGEKFREKRHAWADSARHTGSSLKDRGQAAASKTRDLYFGNPLVGGLAAAAVGAIFGTALPMTRTEDEKLSGAGEAAREKMSEQKDKMVEKAEEHSQPRDEQRKQEADSGPQQTSPQPAIG